ncbi:MAG: prolyl oligopeptidase family serine peptidase [Myxococcota bacterium]
MVRRIVLSLCAIAAACRPAPSPESSSASASADAYVPYLERKSGHETQLRIDGPSRGRYEPGFVPEGAQSVQYPSGEHELLAWYAAPPDASGPRPALIYFHGDFSLAAHDFEAVRPFLDAGLVVMTPALRGENGNPGRLELLYGEIDDAAAAADWLAAQPEVDPEHIYAVGHSIGGAVSAMLALYPEAPLRFTASVGGIYVPETFQRWSSSKSNAALVRFDAFDPMEGNLRTLGPNVRDLVHSHHAYIGEGDSWFHPNAESVQAEADRWGRPFTMEYVAGDHMSSLQPALERFLGRVQADLDSAPKAAQP